MAKRKCLTCYTRGILSTVHIIAFYSSHYMDIDVLSRLLVQPSTRKNLIMHTQRVPFYSTGPEVATPVYINGILNWLINLFGKKIHTIFKGFFLFMCFSVFDFFLCYFQFLISFYAIFNFIVFIFLSHLIILPICSKRKVFLRFGEYNNNNNKSLRSINC